MAVMIPFNSFLMQTGKQKSRRSSLRLFYSTETDPQKNLAFN
ncbi:hypothetical protein SGRA_3543 [Saprospira grandis str. Lewin]|uniref:Uncharacterized protein n=1 Tax=Saprospira grandis (strain Lewin) TaxID=984262 RepID=H6L0A3_SAPGL|nr:hypothetical protein SGRA_3543 [Saprospira grandis str. Lewin]